MRTSRALKRSLAVAAVVASTAVAFSGSAVAATTATTTSNVPLLCPVEYQGQTYVLNYARDYTVTAPANVGRNSVFTVSFDPAPINPRTEFNTKVWDVKFVYNLPAGAKVLGYSLVGGSNLGNSKQTVEFEPGRAIVKATGPFKAGEDADVPTLKVALRAPSTPGEVTTSIAGTSAADPGFRWTAEDPTTFEVGTLPCYPDPAKPVALSKTQVR
ncbi:hypothetical protein [Streptomyces sp. NBC_00158]|uniref:hypothetical protein n=1 Tax=Streptomyces sp. NBC_00158 TaxID=2903627 RepID=UPI002F9181D5